MRKVVFGEPVVPLDVEQLPSDSGSVEFVRVCTAIISRALAERLGRFTIPEVSEPIHIADEGIDAEFVAPGGLALEETGGIVGPGRTVFQFKYRDVTRRPRTAVIRELSRRLRDEFSRVAARCDRYVFMTNIQLTGPQSRAVREAILSSFPGAGQKFIVVWGATEIANALNQAPDLRHLFFARGGLSTLAIAERELKTAYQRIGWPAFVGRADELKALSDFSALQGAAALQVVGPKLVGKTRLVLEGLARLPIAASVVWAATPQHATLELFRDLDEATGDRLLVVDRCDNFSSPQIIEWALTRRHLKTIVIQEGGIPRDVPRLLTQLEVSPLSQEDSTKLIGALAPNRLSWPQESWLREVTAGIPGLILYLISLTFTPPAPAVKHAADLREALEELLRDRYLADLNSDAKRVLQVASLLTVLGVEGHPGKELMAVCRALDLSAQIFVTCLPELERRGLLQRKGRFVEVVPPVLGEYIAGQALMNPERVLSELELEFSGDAGAFQRLLERLRNVPNPEVRRAIRNLFSESGWFTDLASLVRNARKLEVLAPAAPMEAAGCLYRVLGDLNVDDLRSRVSGDTRRALVWTLERLALRADTFDRSARLLLALSEAENESWANNATGLLVLIFHWQHPEVAAPYGVRLVVLRDLAMSSSPGRRRIVAAACGGAFKEHVSLPLHPVTGPEIPQPPYRPETWGEVRSYASAVLEILVPLASDDAEDVRLAAETSLLDSFPSFAMLSIGPERIEPFGLEAVRTVEALGRRTTNAETRMRIVRRVQLVLDRLQSRQEHTAIDLRQRLHDVVAILTAGDFQARLWACVGPPIWANRRRPGDRSSHEEELKQIAAELASNPALLNEHFQWLTSSDAKAAPQMFVHIGFLDRGGPIFATLLQRRPKDGQWSALFAAYLEGWSRESLQAAEDALELVQQNHPDALDGVIIANRVLPQSSRTIERLLRIIRNSARPRIEVADFVAGAAQWDVLDCADMKMVLQAIDDGTPEIRAVLLYPFTVRLARGVALSPDLEDLAWRFLETSALAMRGPRWREWDDLASHLADSDAERVIGLLDTIFRESRRSGHDLRFEQELPLTWSVLLEKARGFLVRFLLSIPLETKSLEIQFALEEILDPRMDAQIITEFLREKGPGAARVVAESLNPDKPGYFELVPEVIQAASGDSRVEQRLHGRLFSGGWTGSAVPMIRQRIESVRRMLSHRDSRVAHWAQEALGDLQNWERQETREDKEDWIWDYRVRRAELEAMVNSHSEPERLWATTRLLQHAPKERVLELLTPQDIENALDKGDIDERTRRVWEAYVKYWRTK